MNSKRLWIKGLKNFSRFLWIIFFSRLLKNVVGVWDTGMVIQYSTSDSICLRPAHQAIFGIQKGKNRPPVYPDDLVVEYSRNIKRFWTDYAPITEPKFSHSSAQKSLGGNFHKHMTNIHNGKAITLPEDLVRMMIKGVHKLGDFCNGKKPIPILGPVLQHLIDSQDLVGESSSGEGDVREGKFQGSTPQLKLDIISNVSLMYKLVQLFMNIHPKNLLRNTLLKEMKLLAYFSHVHRDEFCLFYLDTRHNSALCSLAEFEVYQSELRNGRWWVGGISKSSGSPSSERKQWSGPENGEALSDYYQYFSQLLEEANGEMEERLDRFVLAEILSQALERMEIPSIWNNHDISCSLENHMSSLSIVRKGGGKRRYDEIENSSKYTQPWSRRPQDHGTLEYKRNDQEIQQTEPTGCKKIRASDWSNTGMFHAAPSGNNQHEDEIMAEAQDQSFAPYVSEHSKTSTFCCENRRVYISYLDLFSSITTNMKDVVLRLRQLPPAWWLEENGNEDDKKNARMIVSVIVEQFKMGQKHFTELVNQDEWQKFPHAPSQRSLSYRPESKFTRSRDMLRRYIPYISRGEAQVMIAAYQAFRHVSDYLQDPKVGHDKFEDEFQHLHLFLETMSDFLKFTKTTARVP